MQSSTQPDQLSAMIASVNLGDGVEVFNPTSSGFPPQDPHTNLPPHFELSSSSVALNADDILGIDQNALHQSLANPMSISLTADDSTASFNNPNNFLLPTSDFAQRSASSADLMSVNLSNASSTVGVDVCSLPALFDPSSVNYFTEPSDSKEEYFSMTESFVPEVVSVKRPSVISTSKDDSLANHSRAWIPSAETLTQISTVRSGLAAPKSFAMPGIASANIEDDPVHDLMSKFMGEAAAAKRTIASQHVPESVEGLSQLLAASNYRAALALTRKLLTNVGQGPGKAKQPSQHTEFSLNIWFVRLSLLVRIKQYSLANTELEPFTNLDTADLYFDYYPDVYGDVTGSMVPFSLRLLHAILPQLTGHNNSALQRFSYLENTIKLMLSNLQSGLTETGHQSSSSESERCAAVQLWSDRLLNVEAAFANCLTKMKEYNLALKVYERIAVGHPKLALDVYGVLGRLSVLIGDLAAAASWYRKFDDAIAGNSSSALRIKSLCNNGHLQMFQNYYAEALTSFEAALEIDPTNIMLVNNCSVCLLYLGRLHDSILLLEKSIQANPALALNENLITNLSTLYELASARSMQRKHNVLGLVGQYKGDAFDTSCLKMASATTH